MPSSVKEMLAAANAAVPRLQPAKLREMMDAGDVLIVDVRDPSEVQQGGKIKGAVNVSRGMLEFRADPESPYHNPAFQKEKAGCPLLCVGRALGAEREDAQRAWLRLGLQRGGVQGAGGSGAPDRTGVGRARRFFARREKEPES